MGVSRRGDMIKKEIEYETDFVKWARNQTYYLKNKEFSRLDIDNLIEEIECLGRSEKRTLQSYLEILLMHMLKLKYQRGKHTKSWDLSIKESNRKVQKTLSCNRCLKNDIKEILDDAYYSARLQAARETKLPEETFPEECPWNPTDLFPDLEKKYC